MTYEEQKILLAQTIFAINDKDKFFQIKSYINKLVKTEQSKTGEFNAKLLTFDVWNKQFDGAYKLDDFIEDYGMTVREFRLQIYNLEKGKGMSKQVFFEKLNNL